MASLVLEGDGEKPGLWRELGATLLSPPTGISLFAFGGQFKPVFPRHDPATFWRLRLGVSQNTDMSDQGGSSTIKQDEVSADFSMAYGLPGSPAIAIRVLSTTSILNLPASAPRITLSLTS